MPGCDHLREVEADPPRLGPPPVSDGCVDCLRLGTTWVHLRRCLHCGNVGCCDDSPMRHARAHGVAAGHALVQSFEPGEDWIWCYPDDRGFVLAAHRNSPSYTADLRPRAVSS